MDCECKVIEVERFLFDYVKSFELFDDSLVYQSQHTRRLIVTNYSNFRSNDVSCLNDSIIYSISLNIRILYLLNSLIFDLSMNKVLYSK